MICVAADTPDIQEKVNEWKDEIADIEHEKPIALILTKSDLVEDIDDTVEMFEDTKEQKNLHLIAKASAKEWKDFNVHEAFTKTLAFAYGYKYDE